MFTTATVLIFGMGLIDVYILNSYLTLNEINT